MRDHICNTHMILEHITTRSCFYCGTELNFKELRVRINWLTNYMDVRCQECNLINSVSLDNKSIEEIISKLENIL